MDLTDVSGIVVERRGSVNTLELTTGEVPLEYRLARLSYVLYIQTGTDWAKFGGPHVIVRVESESGAQPTVVPVRKDKVGSIDSVGYIKLRDDAILVYGNSDSEPIEIEVRADGRVLGEEEWRFRLREAGRFHALRTDTL